MFSQKAWGGPVEPHILTKFLHYESTGESDTSDHIISLVIFDWRDRASIGTGDDNDPMGVSHPRRARSRGLLTPGLENLHLRSDGG